MFPHHIDYTLICHGSSGNLLSIISSSLPRYHRISFSGVTYLPDGQSFVCRLRLIYLLSFCNLIKANELLSQKNTSNMVSLLMSILI